MADVTVVLTTYNRQTLVLRALKSLEAQTSRDFEVRIIDDGSTDDTETAVLPEVEQNPHFFYHKQDNRGEAGAKNTGILLAKGRYITFLDSDDEYKPDHIASRLNILREYPDTDLLHGGVEIIGDEYVPDRFNPGEMIHLSECIIGGTFFIRSEAAKTLGGFRDIALGTDSELYDRALAAGLKIRKTDLPTYIYNREEEDSITKQYLKR